MRSTYLDAENRHATFTYNELASMCRYVSISHECISTVHVGYPRASWCRKVKPEVLSIPATLTFNFIHFTPLPSVDHNAIRFFSITWPH